MSTMASPTGAFTSSLADSTTQLNLLKGTYKKSSEKLVTLRNIPGSHFTQLLTGQHEPIPFLQRITVGYSQNLNNLHQTIIKTTSVRCPFTDSYENVKQLTSFFDISARPIGSVLKSPLEIRLNCSHEEIENFKASKLKIVLNCFDYNTRSWYERETDCSTLEQADKKYLSAKVQFFGKFCFTTKPTIQQFLLTEVATCHKITNNSNYCCEISVKDDVIGRNGALVSVYSEKVSANDLERAKNSIGCKTAKVEEILNFKFNINCQDENQKLKISRIEKKASATDDDDSEKSDEKSKIVALVQKNGLTWSVSNTKSDEFYISSGHNYRVIFIETDIGTAQDEKKLAFFGSELEFVQNSTKCDIYVYRHKEELNRIHIGFYEKDEDNWALVAVTRDIVIEELSKVFFRILGADILTEDNSPKSLIFFENNKTGIDFFVYKEPETTNDSPASAGTTEIPSQTGPIQLDIGVNDTVTKDMGIVLTTEINVDENLARKLSPYTSKKNYDHVDPPEIYREYKLQWLKFLSPAEREKYKHINGL